MFDFGRGDASRRLIVIKMLNYLDTKVSSSTELDAKVGYTELYTKVGYIELLDTKAGYTELDAKAGYTEFRYECKSYRTRPEGLLCRTI